jgi:hypothetical protein
MCAVRFCPLILAGLLLGISHALAAELPINDNTGAPYFGVNQGGPVQFSEVNQFTAWLNRTTIWGEGTFAFGPGSDWNNYLYPQGWFTAPAQSFVQEGNGRLVVIGVPMLPGPTDDSGPTTGTNPGPVSLAQGAAGAYNSDFLAMGQNLVASNLGNSILRLGWEFNGNWYAWSVYTPTDAKNFAAFWKQIVTTLRTVPGQNFKFCWGGTVTYVGTTPAWNLSDAFPAGNDASGKPYVDMVGLDMYDSSWTYYPWPANATAAQIQQARQNTWNNVINTSNQYWGAPVWMAIAKANNIPFAVPEWGVSTDTHAGGDNTYYVQQMFNFIQNPANNVYFSQYYDAGESKISPVDGFQTTLVNSAALYQQLYSLPSPSTDIPTLPVPFLVALAFFFLCMGGMCLPGASQSGSRQSE